MSQEYCETRVWALYEEVEQWCERPDNYQLMCVEPQRRLEEFASGKPVSEGVVLTRMGFLANWYSAQNLVALFRGRSASYDLLRQAHRYGFREAHFALALFDRTRGRKRAPRMSANELALRVARAAALGCLPDCRVMGGLLCDQLGGGLFRDEAAVLVGLIARLICDWQGCANDHLPPVDVPVYSALVTEWRTASEARIASILEDACKLHLEGAEGQPGTALPHFGDHVYSVYPVEILLILQLRRHLGLTAPSLQHPLMKMPLGRLLSPSESEVMVPDADLIARVSDRIERLSRH